MENIDYEDANQYYFNIYHSGKNVAVYDRIHKLMKVKNGIIANNSDFIPKKYPL